MNWTYRVTRFDWLIDCMVFYAAFNSISVIALTAHIIHAFLGFTSTRLGSDVSCPRTLPRKNPEDPVRLEPRTPGLQIKHFTTEPLLDCYFFFAWCRRLTLRASSLHGLICIEYVISYFMFLILEMLWIKKCQNLRGGGGFIFPYHSEYFPHAENLELLFLFYCICWQNNYRKYNI